MAKGCCCWLLVCPWPANNVQWANIQDKKKIPMCTPSGIQSPVTCVAGNCSTDCATAAINVQTCTYTTAQDITLITHHNRPKQLCYR